MACWLVGRRASDASFSSWRHAPKSSAFRSTCMLGPVQSASASTLHACLHTPQVGRCCLLSVLKPFLLGRLGALPAAARLRPRGMIAKHRRAATKIIQHCGAVPRFDPVPIGTETRYGRRSDYGSRSDERGRSYAFRHIR
jgi:hypothetical protein